MTGSTQTSSIARLERCVYRYRSYNTSELISTRVCYSNEITTGRRGRFLAYANCMAMSSGISRRVVPTSPDELSMTSENSLDNADPAAPEDLTAGRPLAIKSSETRNLQNSNSMPSLSPLATRQSLEVAAPIDRDGDRGRATPQNVRTLLENSASQGLHCRVPTTPPSDSSTELRKSTVSINKNVEGLGEAHISKDDVEGRRRESEGEKHVRSSSNWSTSKRHELDAGESSREQLAGPRWNQETTTTVTTVKEGDTGANSVSQNVKNLDPYIATVRSLRSLAKLQKRSFAEENQEDISAEINSLSKVRACRHVWLQRIYCCN